VVTRLQRVLIDTGPLIAWMDAADAHHEAVTDLLGRFRGELVSTWPVLTETCHLVPDHLVSPFLRWVGSGGLTVAEVPQAALLALADRMDKYADLPMDLADASLIWLADTLGVLDIITLDRRDFGVYRTDRGRSLRNLLEPPVRPPVRRGKRSQRPPA
jgi:predicted nucleic acid-binding protein